MFGVGATDWNRGDIADERQYTVHVVFASYPGRAKHVKSQIPTLEPIESKKQGNAEKGDKKPHRASAYAKSWIRFHQVKAVKKKNNTN